MVAANVENAWQYAKVYEQHARDGEPTEEYWRWARAGWADQRAQRYPMGRGAKPLYSLWDGQKFSYVEARKKIYIPVYSGAVRGTLAFAVLSTCYKERGEITLWDYDGYDHRKLGMTYDDVVNSETKKCGHGFVLAMMLEGLI
jgi:hypothetical protein